MTVLPNEPFEWLGPRGNTLALWVTALSGWTAFLLDRFSPSARARFKAWWHHRQRFQRVWDYVEVTLVGAEIDGRQHGHANLYLRIFNFGTRLIEAEFRMQKLSVRQTSLPLREFHTLPTVVSPKAQTVASIRFELTDEDRRRLQDGVPSLISDSSTPVSIDIAVHGVLIIRDGSRVHSENKSYPFDYGRLYVAPRESRKLSG